jgi:hypothetical protein
LNLSSKMLLRRAYITAIWAALSSICVSEPTSTAPDSLITPPPRLVERADPFWNDNFIGYYSDPVSNIWLPSTCAGGTLSAFGYISQIYNGSTTWWGGCESTSVYSVFTECYDKYAWGSSIYYSAVSWWTATTSSSCASTCITDTLMEGINDELSSYYIHCDSRTPILLLSEASTDLPALAPATTAASTSSSLPASFTVVTVTSPGTPIPTHSTTPTPSPKSKVGPIVGGIVGGIALLALVAVGIFFILKKRHRRNAAAAAQNQPVMASQPMYQPGMVPAEKTAQVQASPIAPQNPYSPHQSWNPNPNVPAQAGFSPPGSPPPPTYIHPQQPGFQPQQQAPTFQQPGPYP